MTTKLTEKQIDNRIKKVKEYNEKIKELENERDAVREELRKYMIENDVDEVRTTNGVVYYKSADRRNTDYNGLQKKFPEVYNTFVKITSNMRLSIY